MWRDVLTAGLGFGALIGACYAVTYFAEAVRGLGEHAWWNFTMAVCGTTWAVLGLTAVQLWGTS